MPLPTVGDETHLHWTNPSSYADVYEAARAALHAVDPSGVAVVGGLADTANGDVDLQQDERWLAALPPGSVEAVGFHPYPYVFEVSDSLLESDTASLRSWMNVNGFAGVPIDVNEFGACQMTARAIDNSDCPANIEQTSAAWGAAVAGYTRWALCTPSVGVENAQPFPWGAIPLTDLHVWLPLFSSEQVLTAFGKDYLDAATSLTTSGCSPASPAADRANAANTESGHVRIVRVIRRGACSSSPSADPSEGDV